MIELPTLNDILTKHQIHPQFWPEIRRFVEERRWPSREVLTRLVCVANYKAALSDILAELCKRVDHKWPPAGFCSQWEQQRYESLRPEVAALAASGR
jgi:hypothetical protein